MDKGDGTVKYILTGDGAGSLFLIDEKSGDIHATKRLDREEKAMYTLHAKVVDRNTNAELEPDTEFNIKIHDINDNEPKFAREIYFASVPEMSEVGKLRLICLFSQSHRFWVGLGGGDMHTHIFSKNNAFMLFKSYLHSSTINQTVV